MEKNFAKLHSDVCFKRANGKVIWQPRSDCWIADKMFEQGELPGIYKGMSKVDIYKELGCSARIYEYNNCFYLSLSELGLLWADTCKLFGNNLTGGHCWKLFCGS